MANNSNDIRYVGVKENLAYGFANAGQVFGYNLVARGYMLLFFTKVFGLPEGAVSAMILILGIWDTVNDPLMGAVVDKTRTRFGKLRPYLIFVPLPLSIFTILLFAGPVILQDTKSTVIKIVYMYISYFLWEFFYTIGDIPFWSMSSAISPSPADRTRAISSARFISGILGNLSPTILVLLMDLSEKGVIKMSLAQVFLLMAVIAGTFGMGLFSLAGRCCKERVVQSVKEPSVLEGFKVMLKNKPLFLIIISSVLGSVSGISSVFATYYYAEVVHLNSLTILIALPGSILGFLTYLLIPKLKAKFDNRQIIFLNGFSRVIVGTIVFLVGYNNFTNFKVVIPLLMFQNLVFSFFDTVNMVIPTEMIGDTVDYMEWKTGERNEGISFAVLTFVGKLTGSVSTSIGAALLPIIGLSFKKIAGTTDTVTIKGEHTDLYIWALFTFVPQILGLITLIPYIWYDLTGNKLLTIRSELRERHEEMSKQLSGGENDA